MCRSFWLGLIIVMSWSSAALAVQGTVRLKNGGFIEGDVLEHVPGERVTVRLSDGTVRNIPWADVERFEETPTAEPAPLAPSPAPVAAPAASQHVPAPTYEAAPIQEPSPSAEAEIEEDTSHFNRITLTMFGTLGVLGEATYDGVATITDGVDIVEEESSGEADLAVSYGGGLQLDVPLHRHFSIAGLTRILSWTGEDGERRALFVDFLAAPRLRFPFELSPGSLGVFFLQVPIGASYVDLPRDNDASVSAAFAVGVSTGFMALLSEHFGVSIELGWMHRAFSVEQEEEISTPAGFFSADVETDLTMAQPFFQLGLVAAF
jgi:hypothetical protein